MNSQRRPPLPPAGFSLMELLVVLVILGVVAAVSAPAVNRTLVGMERRNKERRILATLRYARLAAIKEGRRLAVRVDEEGRALILAGKTREVRDLQLAEDEHLALQPEEVVYYPEGVATPGRLVLQGDRPLVVTIDPLTGLPVRERQPVEE